MIHTFEISKKISPQTAKDLLKKYYFEMSKGKKGNSFYTSTSLVDQGINKITIQKKPLNNLPGFEYYIYLVINPSVILSPVNVKIKKDDIRNYPTGMNIFTDMNIYGFYDHIYSIIPDLNAYTEGLSRDQIWDSNDVENSLKLLSEWEAANLNSFKLSRIDYTYDIKYFPQEYLILLNRGYKIKFGKNKEYEHMYGEQNIDAKSKSIELKIYDKERQLYEKMKVSPEIAENHPVLRIELSLCKSKLNYIRLRKNKSVKRNLFDFADADISFEEVEKYLRRLAGNGNYVEYDTAIQIIDKSSYSNNIKSKLKEHVLGISKHRGIQPYIESLKIKKSPTEATVRKHLKMIHDLGINPVTISKKGFDNIPVKDGVKFLPPLIEFVRLYHKIESTKDYDDNGNALGIAPFIPMMSN